MKQILLLLRRLGLGAGKVVILFIFWAQMIVLCIGVLGLGAVAVSWAFPDLLPLSISVSFPSPLARRDDALLDGILLIAAAAIGWFYRFKGRYLFLWVFIASLGGLSILFGIFYL